MRRIAEEKLGLADKALDAKKDVLKTLVDEVMASQTENEPAGAAESSSSTVTATAPTETKPAETKPAEVKPELSAEGTQPIRPHRRS